MKAVIQRVKSARLSVDGALVSEIGKGLVIYFGIEQDDTDIDAVKFCQKVAAMRIFSDDNGKMNLSVKDIGGEILLVSNFTLAADISHGNRPSFTGAMSPAAGAAEFYARTAAALGELVPTKTGIFGADMTIDQANDGPVTIIYDSKQL